MSRMDPVRTDPSGWIGRTEDREGRLTTELAGMLGAATSHKLSVRHSLRDGDPVPHLWHWAAFPEFVPLSDLGRDGHPALGSFLPPLGLERRMWAGGQLQFAGRLRIGEPLHRRSEIVSIAEKAGATGPMVFVSVTHVTTGADGGRIEERQDIVYLDIPDQFTPPKKIPVPGAPIFDETVPVNEARLFRYSAATFNAHRIHYDLTYTREVEKYPALIVHGPMQATMLIEAAQRHTGATPKSFNFRGVHPMFHDEDVRLVGTTDPASTGMDLCTATPSGHLGMQARVEWA